jgi:hypothetical protein
MTAFYRQKKKSVGEVYVTTEAHLGSRFRSRHNPSPYAPSSDANTAPEAEVKP